MNTIPGRQCVRLVPSAEIAAVLYAPKKGVEIVHE